MTSTLTIEEYLVLSYSDGKMEYVDNFKRFIEYMDIEVVDIDAAIAEQGAKVRGQYKNFKAMDALQIAVAQKNVICSLQMISSFDKKKNFRV